MEIATLFLIIFLLIVCFVILIVLVRQILLLIQERNLLKQRGKEIEDIGEKYTEEKGKHDAKFKMKQISEIISETEKEIEARVAKSVEVTKNKIKGTKEEKQIIEKAGQQYQSFFSGLRSAIPETDEERNRDMGDLQNAISVLESLDEDSYKSHKKRGDIGRGMFYDQMSRRIKKILTENNLDTEFRFLPEQHIKYLIFSNLKNIKDEDILPILKIMNDTGLFQDIIEINPAFRLVLLPENKIELENTEKVLLTFAYDLEKLNLDTLLEKTNWKREYALEIINNLVRKNIIIFEDNVIKVASFGTPDQRKMWNKCIEEKKQEEKRREEENIRREIERKKQFKNKIEKKNQELRKAPKPSEQIKKEKESKKVPDFYARPSIKQLPSNKEKLKTSIKSEVVNIEPSQEKTDSESLESNIDNLDEELENEIEQEDMTENEQKELNLTLD
ncbi:MAG: hypothetical protein EU550_04075, partial [Promethearchaeota archaeon]